MNLKSKYERSVQSGLDQGEGISLSILRFAVGDAVVLRASDTQGGAAVDMCGLVLLPLLLFRFLCD